MVVLALPGWQLGHGIALQPWPSTLSINLIESHFFCHASFAITANVMAFHKQLCVYPAFNLEDFQPGYFVANLHALCPGYVFCVRPLCTCAQQ